MENKRIQVTIEPRGEHSTHVRVALVIDGRQVAIDTDLVVCIGDLWSREGIHTLTRTLRRELESWLV